MYKLDSRIIMETNITFYVCQNLLSDFKNRRKLRLVLRATPGIAQSGEKSGWGIFLHNKSILKRIVNKLGN
jgi:hypothetical protein